MHRSCLLCVALALLLVSAAPARAGGRDHRVAIVPAGLAGAPLLTEWWREPLSKRADDPTNPFNSGGCRKVAHAIVLVYPGGQCTIRQGTWIFAPGFTFTCSDVEPEPFHADTPLEAARCGLRHARLLTEATLTVDDAKPVSVLDGRFGIFMLPGRVVVPENAIFDGGTPGETMRYGGHGYVAFIRHLPVGEHTLHTHADGTNEGFPPDGFDFFTTITVTR